VVRPIILGLGARGGVARPAGTFIGAVSGVVPATAELTRENLQITQQNPARAAQLVREWLRETAPGGGETG
jgi:hypothetical protein